MLKQSFPQVSIRKHFKYRLNGCLWLNFVPNVACNIARKLAPSSSSSS